MRTSFAIAVSGLVLLGSQVTSQELAPTKPVPQPKARDTEARPANGTQLNDKQQLGQHIAACLLINNEKEIAISELGNDAQDAKVKEFAQEMVKEHTKLVSKLQKYTPQISANETSVQTDREAVPGEPPPSVTKKPATTTPARAGETTAPAAASSQSITDHLIAIERDTAKECLAMSKQELAQKKGAEFDKCFMGMQVAEHAAMLAKLQALDGKVSGELGQVIAEAKKSTKVHLDHAKQLMEEVGQK